MDKNGEEATKQLKLEKKEHQYKFIVDGDWRFAPDQKTFADHNGNINNVIDLTEHGDNDDEEEEEEEEEEEDEEDEKEVKLKGDIEDTCIPMNGYNQEIPKFDEFRHEPPTMPFNLSKNVLDESIDNMPLQNPEYSREFIKAQKDTKVESIFQDRNLKVPTHISLNHAFFYPETN
jgi:5'-AMP-activated protein kinase regulatory beta subunit